MDWKTLADIILGGTIIVAALIYGIVGRVKDWRAKRKNSKK